MGAGLASKRDALNGDVTDSTVSIFAASGCFNPGADHVCSDRRVSKTLEADPCHGFSFFILRIQW